MAASNVSHGIERPVEHFQCTSAKQLHIRAWDVMASRTQLAKGFTFLWVAGKEGVKREMETDILLEAFWD